MLPAIQPSFVEQLRPPLQPNARQARGRGRPRRPEPYGCIRGFRDISWNCHLNGKIETVIFGTFWNHQIWGVPYFQTTLYHFMLLQQNTGGKKQTRLCSCLWAASTSACYSRVTGPHCWIKHQVQIDSPNMEVWPRWTASVSKDHGCRSLALPSPCDRACCRWVHESSTPTIDAWQCGTVLAHVSQPFFLSWARNEPSTCGPATNGALQIPGLKIPKPQCPSRVCCSESSNTWL